MIARVLAGGALCWGLLIASSAQAVDLTGSWTGRWESCSTSHNGVMKADICRIDPAHYRVAFSGRFFKVVPFRYTVTLRVVEDTPKRTTLAGSHDLGRMFGVFQYTAVADSQCFTANYRSCEDQGRFVLSRDCPCCR